MNEKQLASELVRLAKEMTADRGLDFIVNEVKMNIGDIEAGIKKISKGFDVALNLSRKGDYSKALRQANTIADGGDLLMDDVKSLVAELKKFAQDCEDKA